MDGDIQSGEKPQAQRKGYGKPETLRFSWNPTVE
jgi:hypothetical protein